MLYAFIQKGLDALCSPDQGRSINGFKRDVVIRSVKTACLFAPGFIQRGIEATSLNNVVLVWVGFAVADEV